MDAEGMAAVVEALQGKHSLLVAAHVGSAELVAEHIGKGADLAARDGRGRTALLLACAHGHEEPARVLVGPTEAAGALDVVNDTGSSALMLAATKGLVSVTKQLLAAGAKSELTDASRMTALALACVQLGNAERLSGARVSAAETAADLTVGCWVNVTATFMGASKSRKEVLKGSLGSVVKIDDAHGNAFLDFVDIGKQWVSKDDFGNISVLSQDHVMEDKTGKMSLVPQEEVLKWTARRKEVVALLIPATQATGALDVANDEGNTALQHACLHGVCSVAEQLLAAGANPDLVNKDTKTAVDLALQNPEKMEAVVQLLAKRSLLVAAQAGSAELVAEHLASGADLAARDSRGRTVLMAAIEHGDAGIIAALLAAGSKPELADTRGRTALAHACVKLGDLGKVKEIDGDAYTDFYGFERDAQGSIVLVFVKTSDDRELEHIHLQRMTSSLLADKRKPFNGTVQSLRVVGGGGGGGFGGVR